MPETYTKPLDFECQACYDAVLAEFEEDAMISKTKRVGIYVRVSTGDQSTDVQRAELQAWAQRAGHTVVKVFEDQGISGAKGRDKRPAFDALLKAAVRREVEMIAVWSSDRLGRSLSHLVEVLQTIRDTGTGLYVHTQAVDTTTPAGRALFGMLGVFAEFEREMIVARVNAGLARAKEAIATKGVHRTKRGTKVTRLGRPGAKPEQIEAARAELAKGTGILKAARLAGLGTGTVHKLAREMRGPLPGEGRAAE
jgi:DNA invertase Pin-like site-specific DNA recombinase